MSIATSDGIKWKTMSYIPAATGYPETWKSIGNPGTMLNGEAIPDFYGSPSDAENSGIANTQDLRLRKIDDAHVHLQGVIKVRDYEEKYPGSPDFEITIIRLPTGYRPIFNINYDALIQDTNNDTYYEGQFQLSHTGFLRFSFYKPSTPSVFHSYLTFDHIIAID